MKTLDDLPRRWRLLLGANEAALERDTVAAPDADHRPDPGDVRPHDLNLPGKLVTLEREFEGQPLACLAHAALIVLIRRDIALPDALDRYFALWESHADLLLDRLNLRWLISAADTLADHGRDPAERATAFAAVLFANTIKLYETERYFALQPGLGEADLNRPVPEFSLDGVVPFRVARGDTVGNMFKRKDRLVPELGLAGRLLDRAMRRACEVETVYARFRRVHQTKEHAW